MKLSRFTSTGIERFSAYVAQLRSEPTLAPPFWLLDDGESSECVADVNVVPPEFANRLAAARFLDDLFAQAGLKNVETDVGLWAWLTLCLFDQVCPPNARQARKPREDIRYFPAVGNYQKYYRHLLLGPYVVFRAHREHISEAMAMLASPVHIISDVVEQIASRQERISNPAVIRAVTDLYIDKASLNYKRGAGGKGDGSPRRFHEVLDQFDLTYDTSGMSALALISLLPHEFDRFRL